MRGGPGVVRAYSRVNRYAFGHSTSSVGQRLAASGRATAAAMSHYVRTSYSISLTRAHPIINITRNISRHSLQVIRALSGQAPGKRWDENYLLNLDWKPDLPAAQEVIAWSVPIIACLVVYILTVPAAISIPYGTCLGVLFGMMLVWIRSLFMESLYKAKEVMESELGDADSKFTRLENLLVHVKTKDPSSSAAQPCGVHCFHGFGSNTWSWSKVQQSLADSTGAVVTAHDMPGFGLTQRPTDLSGYLLSFNGRLGRLVLDHELAARDIISQVEADKVGGSSYPHTSVTSTLSLEPPAAAAAADKEVTAEIAPAREVAKKAVAEGLETPVSAAAAAAAKGDVLGAIKGGMQAAAAEVAPEGGDSGSSSAAPLAPSAPPAGADAKASQGGVKRVLMGHSLGAACAALEVIADPKQYAALILVDAAILSMGKGDGESPPLHLEELHDDSAFTRSLGTQDEAVAGQQEAGSSSSRSSSSVDLEALATTSSLTRQDSLLSTSSVSMSGSMSGSSSSESGAGVPNPRSNSSRANMVAGEPVVYYAAKGKVGRAPQSTVSLLTQVVERITALTQAGFLMTILLVISALRPIILLGLRAVVRSRGFWKSTLQQAYYDKTKVDDEMVNAYRLPQLVKGWEAGMMQFLVARLGAGPTGGAAGSPFGGLEDTKLAERLAAVVNAHQIPVLIIHGQGDKLVPVQNSFRLAKMMNRSRLAVLKRSGHCPQEEIPEAFAELTSRFLKGVMG